MSKFMHVLAEELRVREKSLEDHTPGGLDKKGHEHYELHLIKELKGVIENIRAKIKEHLNPPEGEESESHALVVQEVKRDIAILDESMKQAKKQGE